MMLLFSPHLTWLSVLLFLLRLHIAFGYDIVRDYSGSTFFQGWDFYGYWDNLTLGDVWWLDEQDAFSQGLAAMNNAGNIILKVDNTSYVPLNQKRNSVRITSQDSYDVGSLWIIDLLHIPYGCSVWPAWWTKGPLWPNDGEIDIIEAINVMPNNQMALHTTPGCTHSTPPNQSGVSGQGDCSLGSGCVVSEVAPNSYESGFAAAGGGVWATQFDVAGIFIWFWSRADVPPSIAQATSTSSIDLSDWGNPSASYLSTTCNITEFFTAQNLVLDITLCGDWAGVPAIYTPACGNAGPTGLCYNDNVVGSGANYDQAYFEIQYIRAYTTNAASPTSSGNQALETSPSSSTSSSASQSSSPTPTPAPTSDPSGNGVARSYEQNMGHIFLLLLLGAVLRSATTFTDVWW